MSPESKATSKWLLHELMPLAGIARTMQVSEDWLQGYVNLWESMPGVARQCAVVDTDDWVSEPVALPSTRPNCRGQTGLTNYIQRFNHTWRQRVARLQRFANEYDTVGVSRVVQLDESLLA